MEDLVRKTFASSITLRKSLATEIGSSFLMKPPAPIRRDATLRVEELSGPDALEAMTPEWEELDAQVSPRSPFTSRFGPHFGGDICGRKDPRSGKSSSFTLCAMRPASFWQLPRL